MYLWNSLNCTDCLPSPLCCYYILFCFPSLLLSTLTSSTFSTVDWVQDLCLCRTQVSHRARNQVSCKIMIYPLWTSRLPPHLPTLPLPPRYAHFFPLPSPTAITPCLPQVATAWSPHSTSSCHLTHPVIPALVLWIPT